MQKTIELPPLATYHDFEGAPPHETVDGVRHWYAPAQNFVVDCAQGDAGQSISVVANPDEYCLIMASGPATVKVTAGSETAVAKSQTLVVVPPGDSRIEFTAAGFAYRVMTHRTEVYARARQLAPYDEPLNAPAELVPWPDPKDGFRLRTYETKDYDWFDGHQRIFRTTNMMINLLPARDRRRPLDAFTPHQHEDFQQASLVTAGEYVHHMRRPWGKDSRIWHEDEHRRVTAPSVTVIHPQEIHTSQSVGGGVNQLIDIFCPPRRDFSEQGKVLNASDYPMPAQNPASAPSEG